MVKPRKQRVKKPRASKRVRPKKNKKMYQKVVVSVNSSGGSGGSGSGAYPYQQIIPQIIPQIWRESEKVGENIPNQSMIDLIKQNSRMEEEIKNMRIRTEEELERIKSKPSQAPAPAPIYHAPIYNPPIYHPPAIPIYQPSPSPSPQTPIIVNPILQQDRSVERQNMLDLVKLNARMDDELKKIKDKMNTPIIPFTPFLRANPPTVEKKIPNRPDFSDIPVNFKYTPIKEQLNSGFSEVPIEKPKSDEIDNMMKEDINSYEAPIEDPIFEETPPLEEDEKIIIKPKKKKEKKKKAPQEEMNEEELATLADKIINTPMKELNKKDKENLMDLADIKRPSANKLRNKIEYMDKNNDYLKKKRQEKSKEMFGTKDLKKLDQNQLYELYTTLKLHNY